jgi:CMP-N,N'-diacetyllegionaminic acid synthase
VPHHYNPHWVYFCAADGSLRLSTGETTPIPRRQELPSAFHREGSIYVVLRDVLIEGDSLYGRHLIGYPMDPATSVTIDEPNDLKRLEQILEARLVTL